MIPYQNRELFASIIFYLVSKIFCLFYVYFRHSSMTSRRQPTLTSIPEKGEIEEENGKKWVAKKKHEVLKAKYKCLKKLFQIYDASLIGILPDPYSGQLAEPEPAIDPDKPRRRKRSHKTKTDALVGTSELSSAGDVSADDDYAPTELMKDLKLDQYTSSHFLGSNSEASQTKIHPVQDNVSTSTCEQDCGCDHNVHGLLPHPDPPMTHLPSAHLAQHLYPCLMNEKRRLTRFQCLMHRIFGIKQDRIYSVLPNGHVFAASDNNISQYHERRKRRGLRFRRLGRPKKVRSESALRDARSPAIMSYVQSVQRNCLKDMTPRQCPIGGCGMILYGIINYNDHLNLCHFPERKHICHYCHEGFENDCNKFTHENEHIGLNKMNNIMSAPSTDRNANKKTEMLTQTEPEQKPVQVHDEKLKKIVSFFDKIVDQDNLAAEIKKKRYSESNILKSDTTDSSVASSGKRTVSCVHSCQRLHFQKNFSRTPSSNYASKCSSDHVHCSLCGEEFKHRRQLSLHVDLEHRVHDKFSKFHSCAGIINTGRKLDLVSEDGKVLIESVNQSCSGLSRINTSSTLTRETDSDLSRRKSEETLSCDPSTNIVYYTSVESVQKKPSSISTVVTKVKKGINNYRWEPGTKIIRV